MYILFIYVFYYLHKVRKKGNLVYFIYSFVPCVQIVFVTEEVLSKYLLNQ